MYDLYMVYLYICEIDLEKGIIFQILKYMVELLPIVIKRKILKRTKYIFIVLN